MTTGLDVEAVLRDHEPVLGRMGPLTGIVGCSCLSARDYRAAGFKAGQAGWRAHVAAVLRVEIAAWLRGDDALYAAAYRESDDLMGVLSALADQLDPYHAPLAATEGDRP